MRILLPVDGSKFSQAIVEFIASRKALHANQAQIDVLNVQLPIPARALRVVGKEAVQDYYQDESAKAVRPAVEALNKSGVPADGTMRVGHPAEEIAKYASERQADLIVVGSHGHGAFAGLLLGSTTNELLARTDKPLLILRSRSISEAALTDSLKVGIAIDGSKYGTAAVQYVLQHRSLFGAKPTFVLINVVPDFAGAVMPDMAGIALPALNPGEIKALQDQSFETAIGPARQLFEKEGIPVETVALVGMAGDEIAAYADKSKLDLLVLGSHGYGAFRQAVLGSVATRVAAHCATPLLLVR